MGSWFRQGPSTPPFAHPSGRSVVLATCCHLQCLMAGVIHLMAANGKEPLAEWKVASG
jgi:hypothetical protein